MDGALAIRDYLPSSFKNQNDADYIAFLWETFEGVRMQRIRLSRKIAPVFIFTTSSP